MRRTDRPRLRSALLSHRQDVVRRQSDRTAPATSRTPWQPHCLDHGETQKKFSDAGFTYAEHRNHARQRYSPPGNRSLGQESRSEISLEGTGFFTKDTTGLGTTERSTNTGGSLVAYRYKLNRWIAAEAVYGYDRNSPSITFRREDFREFRQMSNRQRAASSFVRRHPGR
jgi:hypothetical protein